MVDLMNRGVRTIVFGRARIVAELMYRYVKQELASFNKRLSEQVRAYRGGYLPEERREIERQLFSGELMGITSTNALELGIDIGGLDAAIIVGFPGTVASIWQQAGRAGRALDDSLVVFVAYNDPIDQYLMRHPVYFFGQSPENAVVDPENPYVLANHLPCAAFELPIVEERDNRYFGSSTGEVSRIIEETGDFKNIDGTFYWSSTKFPAKSAGLRTISDNTFTIVDTSGPKVESADSSGYRVIGQVDSISAPELVYPQAIYMHEAETYFVDDLDLEARVAYVRRMDVDYYTNAILDASIRVQRQTSEREWAGASVCVGDATVTWATTGFKKIKFYSLDSIGYGKVDIPAQHLETTAVWITIPDGLIETIRDQGRKPIEGLMAIRNLACHALPLFAMCDKQDIGGIVDSSNTGSPTVFIYDRYPGGLGFAEKGYQMVERLMQACLDMVTECGCEDGCPSCVGMPVLRPAIHTDPDVFGAFPIPDKEAALLILRHLLADSR
jgi:DEAD/DEAH box helicase domain-containing protein